MPEQLPQTNRSRSVSPDARFRLSTTMERTSLLSLESDASPSRRASDDPLLGALKRWSEKHPEQAAKLRKSSGFSSSREEGMNLIALETARRSHRAKSSDALTISNPMFPGFRDESPETNRSRSRERGRDRGRKSLFGASLPRLVPWSSRGREHRSPDTEVEGVSGVSDGDRNGENDLQMRPLPTDRSESGGKSVDNTKLISLDKAAERWEKDHPDKRSSLARKRSLGLRNKLTVGQENHSDVDSFRMSEMSLFESREVVEARSQPGSPTRLRVETRSRSVENTRFISLEKAAAEWDSGHPDKRSSLSRSRGRVVKTRSLDPDDNGEHETVDGLGRVESRRPSRPRWRMRSPRARREVSASPTRRTDEQESVSTTQDGSVFEYRKASYSSSVAYAVDGRATIRSTDSRGTSNVLSTSFMQRFRNKTGSRSPSPSEHSSRSSSRAPSPFRAVGSFLGFDTIDRGRRSKSRGSLRRSPYDVTTGSYYQSMSGEAPFDGEFNAAFQRQVWKSTRKNTLFSPPIKRLFSHKTMTMETSASG